MKIIKYVASLFVLCLTTSSYATSLTGQAFTATLSYAPTNYLETVTGIVGAGYEVSTSWYVLELDADELGRVYSYTGGAVYQDVFKVEITFPDLLSQQFSVPSGAPFQKNSKWGWSWLEATESNQLTFSYGGSYYDPYGSAFYDWWGYNFEANPNYQPDGNGGGTNVPEPSGLVLIGLGLLGLIASRRRLGMFV